MRKKYRKSKIMVAIKKENFKHLKYNFFRCCGINVLECDNSVLNYVVYLITVILKSKKKLKKLFV